MSYCRFSSNNWDCDVYCYEDVDGGYTTHVAGNKVVGEIPKVPIFGTISNEEWMKAYEKQSEFIMNCQRKPIGLLHDGESFNDPGLQSFLDRLLYLQKLGYTVPDYVVKTIQYELSCEKPLND